MLCGKKLPYYFNKIYSTNIRFCSYKMLSNMSNIYKDLTEIGNRDCSYAYGTNGKCYNNLCCKNAYPNGNVDQTIKDNFFEKIPPRIKFVEELRHTTNELRMIDGYIKWTLLNSQQKKDWPIYQKAFGLIAHKSQCILNQARMLYQDAPPSWDERTYHHIGSMNLSEKILEELVRLNQYAIKLREEEMRQIIMEEIQENSTSAEQPPIELKRLITLSKVIACMNREVELLLKQHKAPE